eukprot:5629108-Amphidinium_carterae.1
MSLKCGKSPPKGSINGSVALVVWDLAIRGADGFTLTPDEAAKTELEPGVNFGSLVRSGS